MRFRFLALFFLVIFLSGCGDYSEKLIEDEAWQDEVLLAQECGLEGMICCKDAEPGCSYGLECCVNPRKPEESTCSKECSCGTIGSYCCEDESGCDDGSVCRDDYCQECGGEDMPCCANQLCDGGLMCHNSICKECGQNNNPCCEGEIKCLNQDKRNNTRNECQNDVCVSCGFAGSKQCHENPFCNLGNLTNNNLCYQCGGYNQPCCKNEEIGKDYCGEGYNCNLGFCS